MDYEEENLSKEDLIIGYCGYCKDEVSYNEKSIKDGKIIYHEDCYNQMNTFNENEEEEEV